MQANKNPGTNLWHSVHSYGECIFVPNLVSWGLFIFFFVLFKRNLGKVQLVLDFPMLANKRKSNATIWSPFSLNSTHASYFQRLCLLQIYPYATYRTRAFEGHASEIIFFLNLFFPIRLLAFHLVIYGKSNQNPPNPSLESTFPTQLKGSCSWV